MAYKRQIAYLDLFEDGQKKGNAGFCKWEYRDGCHVLFVSVSRVPENRFTPLVVYTGSGSQLGELRLQKGKAESIYRLEERSDLANEDFSKIRIPLSQGRELAAEMQMQEEIIRQSKSDENVAKVGMTPTNKEAITTEKIEEMEETLPQESTIDPQKEQDVLQEKQGTFQEEQDTLQEEQEPASFWERLAYTREKIRPFGTETEYYRIATEDIFRLQEEYHKLRNNPFLLHGYYNYHYLILGKKDDLESEYWLGVPGIYHEREKMAARMYGFEKFEGTKPDYHIGDLGYYLITAK